MDGDLETQWASAALNDQWLWVDLLGLYAVNRVVILFNDVPQEFVPWSPGVMEKMSQICKCVTCC